MSNRRGAISDANKGKQQCDQGKREANKGKRRFLETDDVARRLFDGSENERRFPKDADTMTPVLPGK